MSEPKAVRGQKGPARGESVAFDASLQRALGVLTVEEGALCCPGSLFSAGHAAGLPGKGPRGEQERR